MTSERLRRQLDRLLDEVEAALARSDWAEVRRLSSDALRLDPASADALAFLAAAECDPGPGATAGAPAVAAPPLAAEPDSFAGGRYRVRKFLGEGGKKRVYLAHDALLDRDVAFALIKTEGLDDSGRERVLREAQVMGRMGAHPHIVSIFDLGEHAALDGTRQPYVVTELMGGGDVEGLLAREGGALPLARSCAQVVGRGARFAQCLRVREAPDARARLHADPDALARRAQTPLAAV